MKSNASKTLGIASFLVGTYYLSNFFHAQFARDIGLVASLLKGVGFIFLGLYFYRKRHL